MDATVLIIPLIALAVWVLQYVFKGPDDKKQQQQNRQRNAGPRTAVNRPRRQANDLDRFLEETRKRKQEEERKPTVIAQTPADKPPMDRGEAVERERRAASKPPPPPPLPPPRVEKRQARPYQQPPVRKPSLPQPGPVMLEIAPSERPTQARNPSASEMARQAKAESAPTITPPTKPRETFPVLSELMKLLRRPQGVALGIVLHEILEPPVSRRPLK